MGSNLDNAARRRILADIGIDVWRVRTGVPAVREDAESLPPPAGAVSRPRVAPVAAGTAAGTEQPESRSGDRSRNEVGSRSGDRSYDHAADSRSPAEPVAPFVVLSLVVEGVALLLDRAPSAREVPLVRDLLGAATGRWGIEPAPRRFEWPPAIVIPGADGAGAADRALRAFVAKELADHGCTLVMLGAALARRLGALEQVGETLLIPDLAMLGRDPAEKKRIWAALGRHRRTTVAGAPIDAGSGSGPP